MRERIEDFWERVTPLIKLKYPSIKDFCEDAGLNVQTFYNDRTRNYYPPMDNIKRMADKLDVPLDYLVFGETEGTGYSEETVLFIQKYRNANKPVRDIVDKILSDPPITQGNEA